MLTLVFAVGVSAHAQQQTVLDFENLPNPTGTGGSNNQVGSVTQNNYSLFIFASQSFRSFSTLAADAPPSLNYTGSTALANVFANSVSVLSYSGSDSGLFTVNSIDMANYFTQTGSPGNAASVVFTGNFKYDYLHGQSPSVTLNYTHGANDSLETVNFGSLFANVQNFTITQGAVPIQFDNIHLTTAAVPEAGTLLALGGMSALGLVSVRRFRRA